MTEPDNLSLARRFTDRFNAGDSDGLIECCAPDIEFHSTFAAVGSTVYHGHDGLRSWYRDLGEAWAGQIRSELETLFDLGDQALVFTVIHATGRHSGADAALPIAAVFRTRDGLITYYKAYLERQDALDELGVLEESLEAIQP